MKKQTKIPNYLNCLSSVSTASSFKGSKILGSMLMLVLGCSMLLVLCWLLAVSVLSTHRLFCCYYFLNNTV